ncbi:MAG: ribonuclease PH [Candidatus Omnitrophica bacterium]|nr:ribonuclease PH [Candidatus Omnitrophota bacterium]
MIRAGNRAPDALRKVRIKTGFIKYAEGSCLIEIGNTKVICTASLEDGVPLFLRGQCRGWITAEYAMLPRSCGKRIQRESSRGKVGGRTHEIQRLIGRSLRSVVDLELLGERTIFIDCDVIQADGGTRTASITGSFVALASCLKNMENKGILKSSPLRDYMAAISAGIVNNNIILDLDYEEDSNADVDMNVVMTASGDFIEIQATAERRPFNDRQMAGVISFAKKGIKQLVLKQKEALKN